MTHDICKSIHIKSVIRGDGILGGKYEYDPFVTTWTSFGAYRVERKYNYKEYAKVPNTIISKSTLATRKMLSRKYAVNDEKMKAFCSMLSLNDKKSVAEEEEEIKHSDEPIIHVPENTTLYELSDIVTVDRLGHYNKMRGDATIWFKLMTHTDYSGVDQIDKMDEGLAVREVPDGILTIELVNLFGQYVEQCYQKENTTCMIKTVFIDPKVTSMFIKAQVDSMSEKKRSKLNQNEFIQKAYEATYKAMAYFEVHIEGFNYENYHKSIFARPSLRTEFHALSSKCPLFNLTSSNDDFIKSSSSMTGKEFKANSSSKLTKALKKNACITPSSVNYVPYLYNSTKSMNNMMKHFEQLLVVYCNSFINMENRISHFQPMNKNVANLQLPVLLSEQGQNPAISYWTDHDPYTREYPNENFRKEDLELYGHDANTEKYFKMMANSALRRYGLNKKRYISVIDEHYSVKNKSLTVNDLLSRCIQATIDIGTAGGNSFLYTADTRYVPIYDVKNASSSKNHVIRRSMDSFDNEILNLGSNSDDCEGLGNASATILQSFAFGRYDLGCGCGDDEKVKKNRKKGSLIYQLQTPSFRFSEWNSRLLQRIQLIIHNSFVASIGGTVTSAYVDTNNKTINIRDSDLPIVGDQIDLNSSCDGHCFAQLINKMTTARMLKNGGNHNSQELIDSIKPYYLSWSSEEEYALVLSQYDKFMARENVLNNHTMEGTSSIDSTVIPINETYKNNDIERRRVTTEKLFLKELKVRLMALAGGIDMNVNNEKTKDRDTIMNMFQAEGMPFYIESQEENRRVSSFFREGVQVLMPMLYLEHDITHSQGAFCKKDDLTGEFKYGVNMGDVIRSGSSPTAKDVAIISPYRNSKKQWVNDILPMMESIQNQMPIMAFARYTVEQYKNEIYSYYIDPKTMAMNDYRFPVNKAEIDNMTEKVKKSSLVANRKRNIEKFHNVCENSNQTIIRFYSRTWKLNKSKEDFQKLQQFFETLPGVIHYGYFVEKYFPNCPAVIEFLFIVDIDKFEKITAK
jgi:hypothetical protein